MNHPLNIVVTSGGTRVPIDDVRLITNISHGATGAAIATKALEIGHHVRYIGNSDTCLPYIGNPLSESWSGLTRDQDKYMKFMQSLKEGRLELKKAETFDAYQEEVMESIRPEQRTDVIVLSAAVSDFGPKSLTSGKIVSDGDTSIELSPLPKIRNLIRHINKDIFIIAFKQMPEQTTESELFEKAFSAMQTGDIDLTVANITRSIRGRFSAQATWILRNDGTSEKIERRKLPEVLMERELSRHPKIYP